MNEDGRAPGGVLGRARAGDGGRRGGGIPHGGDNGVRAEPQAMPQRVGKAAAGALRWNVPPEIAERVIVATRPVGSRSELELIPDPQTGVIVIIGPNAEARGAEAMLKSWDSDSYLPAMDLKVVDVKNGDAEAIASTVGELLSDRSRWPLKLRAAADSGLQVGEPRISADLMQCDNLVMLPHLGSATLEAREAMGFRVLDNLNDFFEGRVPRDRVI